MDYGQFCPVAKAMELLGEKWTLLVLRELHVGADAQLPVLDFRQYFHRYSSGARNLAKII